MYNDIEGNAVYHYKSLKSAMVNTLCGVPNLLRRLALSFQGVFIFSTFWFIFDWDCINMIKRILGVDFTSLA